MTGEQLGLKLKRDGKARAIGKHLEDLQFAQRCAVYVARGSDRPITAEDVRAYIEREITLAPWKLGSAAGAIFDGPEWECAGVTTAKRPEAHGRLIRTWRLK